MISKYSSMNSLRPMAIVTVPRACRALQRATRSVRPSRVRTAETIGSAGIGFPGVAKRSMRTRVPVLTIGGRQEARPRP